MTGNHDIFRVFNTLGNKKVDFHPRQTGVVRLFTCGPSVYRRQHLGNYRAYLFADILHKHLEHQGHEVRRCINFTDVEDKAIAEAQDKGVSVESLREPVERAFFEDCEMLGIHLPPDIPRATTSVPTAVELIKTLIDKGHAYWHEGDVFFDPLTYKGFGQVFGLDMSKWPKRKKRYRKDTYPGQKWNLGDFILWRGYRESDGDVFWDTDIGRGRPAWNIQDPAMCAKTLGFEIDIHTGGIDNIYRHHDYNRAIMESASGREFCPHWMHCEPLLVNGEKMSKSKGNIWFPEDLADLGLDPATMRFFLLSVHHRDKHDLTEQGALQTRARMKAWRAMRDAVLMPYNSQISDRTWDYVNALEPAFARHMNNDLDFKRAFDAVYGHVLALTQIARDVGISPKQQFAFRAAMSRIDRTAGVFMA